MHIEVFEGKKIGPKSPPRWYWHFASKGRITADSEAFPTKAHAVRAAKSVVRAVVKEVGVSPDPVTFETLKTPPSFVTIIRWN